MQALPQLLSLSEEGKASSVFQNTNLIFQNALNELAEELLATPWASG